MIPQAETIMNIPMIPANICVLPLSRAVGSSPFKNISTIPQTKTTIVTANINMMSGLTIFAMIGLIIATKAGVGSGDVA